MRTANIGLLCIATSLPSCVLAPAIVDRAEAAPLLDQDASDDIATLGAARVFHRGLTGFVPVLSPEGAALRRLVRHPHALHIFEDLLDDQNRAARLYALSALWFLRPDAFTLYVNDLRGDQTVVFAQSGCSGEAWRFDEILDGSCELAWMTERGTEAVVVVLEPGAGQADLHCLRQDRGIAPDAMIVFCGFPGVDAIELIDDTLVTDADCLLDPDERPRLQLPGAP